MCILHFFNLRLSHPCKYLYWYISPFSQCIKITFSLILSQSKYFISEPLSLADKKFVLISYREGFSTAGEGPQRGSERDNDYSILFLSFPRSIVSSCSSPLISPFLNTFPGSPPPLRLLPNLLFLPSFASFFFDRIRSKKK